MQNDMSGWWRLSMARAALGVEMEIYLNFTFLDAIKVRPAAPALAAPSHQCPDGLLIACCTASRVDLSAPRARARSLTHH
jgi:hypothetical protein